MKRFRLYSIIIISLLVILLGYNVYCLFELYEGINRQTTELITQSLRDADLDEILNRANKFPTEDAMPAYQGKAMSQSRRIEGDTLFTAVMDENDSVMEIRRTPLSPGTNYSDIMVLEIGYGAHQTFDPVFPFDIADMDSLFRLSLSRKGIEPEVAFVTKVSADGNVIASDTDLIHLENLDSVSVCFNIMSQERYVAYFSSPTAFILRQMQGIIISTAAVIALITIALWYLLHTVSRLRSIEEMKDDFVSNMTHELKTPIAIAYSANDALLNYDTDKDTAKKRKYLMIANRQLRRLEDLVEGILAMSMERRKTISMKKESIFLCQFLEELVAVHQIRGDKDVEIVVNGDAEVKIEADKTHFANVLNNLIDNAVKYSGDSVRIAIDYNAEGISVADNGIGIPEKSLPHIFNRFYRVPHGNRQDVRGYGIGLYYVKCILDKMGWTIDVKSKLGKGTTFRINFGKDGNQNTLRGR